MPITEEDIIMVNSLVREISAHSSSERCSLVPKKIQKSTKDKISDLAAIVNEIMQNSSLNEKLLNSINGFGKMQLEACQSSYSKAYCLVDKIILNGTFFGLEDFFLNLNEILQSHYSTSNVSGNSFRAAASNSELTSLNSLTREISDHPLSKQRLMIPEKIRTSIRKNLPLLMEIIAKIMENSSLSEELLNSFSQFDKNQIKAKSTPEEKALLLLNEIIVKEPFSRLNNFFSNLNQIAQKHYSTSGISGDFFRSTASNSDNVTSVPPERGMNFRR